jgi:hypothetical protein
MKSYDNRSGLLKQVLEFIIVLILEKVLQIHIYTFLG